MKTNKVISFLEAMECSSLRHLILCVCMCVSWARLWWIALMKCAQCFLSITPHRFPSLCVLCPFYWLAFILFSFHTGSEMKRCKLFFLLIKRMKAGICFGFADCIRLKVNRVTQIWKFLNHIPPQNNIRHQSSKGPISIESSADLLFLCQRNVCAVTSG